MAIPISIMGVEIARNKQILMVISDLIKVVDAKVTIVMDVDRNISDIIMRKQDIGCGIIDASKIEGIYSMVFVIFYVNGRAPIIRVLPRGMVVGIARDGDGAFGIFNFLQKDNIYGGFFRNVVTKFINVSLE